MLQPADPHEERRTRTAVRWAAFALILGLGLFHVLRLPAPAEPSHLSLDGRQYLAGAESILHDGHYRDVEGKPQQIWPPGTSLLYAGASRMTGLPPIALAICIGALCYVTLALACIGIVEVAEIRTPVAAAMLAAILCNGVIVSMQNKLWSEPPALACIGLLVLALTAAIQRPARAAPLLAAACVLAAAAILFRYAMVPAIPVVMIVAVVLRRRVFALAAPLAIVPTLLALNLLGASRGERTFAWHGTFWRRNAEDVMVLVDQVFPVRLGVTAAILFAVCCLIVPIAVDRRGATLVAWLWAAGYAAFLPLAQSTATPSFFLEARLLSPLYIGAILTTAAAAETAARQRSRLALAALALPLLLAAVRAVRYTITQMP